MHPLDGGAALGPWLLALLLWLLGAQAALAEGFPGDGDPAVVRFGSDGPRTRLVVDLDQPVAFTAAVLAEPPRLIIETPRLRWRETAALVQPPGALATAWRVEPAGDRSLLIVDMQGPFRIIDRFLLPPADGARRFRLVVDLEPDARAPPPPPAVTTAAVPPPGVRPPAARPAPRERGDARPVIVLDAGHGGIDPGTIGVGGIREKDVTLAMARELRAQLEATGRYRVVMTRDADIFIPLNERVRIGREARGELFLSLHADSLGDGERRGASVYTLSDVASDAEAARLAARENRADILAGTDLTGQDPLVAGILLDLAFRDTTNRAVLYADGLVQELGGVTELLRNHRRFAGFVVLKSPSVPSVLIELGFLSNPADARNLADPDHRRRLAAAIVRSVDRYMSAARAG
jgi:N-acetylmuramoyl-L-alanine amidase